MASTYTQESNFEYAIHHPVADLWQTRNEGYYRSFDNTRLFWCSLTDPAHDKVIVVVNGRIESAWKYQELFYDLFQQGYDIYAYDHRGQGLSDRLIEEREMGFVGEFDDYVQDLSGLVAMWDLRRYQQRFLLGHSMGGAVVTRYVQTHPHHDFSAMALSAPMFGVSMPWQLRPVAMPLTQFMTALYRKPTYAPGYSAYYAKPFEINPLTQSEVRYRWFRELYEQKPELKLGGPSTRWVWQGLMAAKQCIQLTRQIRIPTLVLQAEADTIVSNAAQVRFITKLARTNPASSIEVIAGARHEVLFERDPYRNQALDAMLAHFAKAEQTHAG
ncbi:alpha/beta fold hydrolase [Vibrio ostreae]|uniref:Alpha/beta fold hydrolase n=1 Tax=Vibrio ostreae TaxID=2841925 RepID=A0A975YN83_9VIBR|nr:alpha/beta fold hydrolase [Vibrio ostreae]QXO17492.1 alpha/beta fold hydrolase [Vibrio ostreae]